MTSTITLIRNAIFAHRISTYQAAKRLVITQAYLDGILRGKTPVSAWIAVRLERLFGLDAIKLLTTQAAEELARAREELRA